MGVGLGAKKENGKLRGRLCHRSCSHASCLFALPCPPEQCWPWCQRGGGSSLLPLIQQLLDTPAAEEDVGDFLQGPLQALPPCAHLHDGYPESSVSQNSSKGEGQGLG